MARSLMILTILLLAGAAGATTWNVRQDGLGDFATIQGALAVAQHGDEIVVWPGVWRESTYIIEHDIILRSEAGPDVTILDGDGLKRVMQIAYALVTVSGFSIRNGSSEAGAGLLVENGGRATLTKCAFTGNRSQSGGGAILVRHLPTSLSVRDCDFTSNFAEVNAGAIAAELATQCDITACTFRDNKAGESTGAVSAVASTILFVRRCTFVGNDGPVAGALSFVAASGFVQHNTFVANRSGSASVVATTFDPVLFTGNIVADEANGYGLSLSRDQSRGCNIFFGNKRGPIENRPLDDSDLAEDPLFCSPETGEYGLCADSPALSRPSLCGVIGALAASCSQCGPVAAEPTSWGSLKALYR